MSFLRYCILFMGFPLLVSAQEHLLISEFVVLPTAGEFIEIHNPTANPIELSNYYLTDATNPGSGFYYYNVVTNANAGGGSLGDFHARFPQGAVIAPGEYQTIAMSGTAFITTYGVSPTYELFNTDAAIPDLREALPGSINNQGGLSNDGEVIILYYWDGQSDLVQDVDYAVWGDKMEAVDKTGISIDGPDPDNDPSSYLNDTPIQLQISISPSNPHETGRSVQRLNAVENGETLSGGNGIAGHDETSENLAASFKPNLPTPNAAPPASNPPQISNVGHAPANPFPSDPVTVSATVTDDGILVSVQLFFSLNGSAFDSTAMSAVGGNIYSAVIAAQPQNTTVQYFVKAIDNDNLFTLSATASYTVGAPPQITPIADIQANPSAFTTVTIQGIVTLGAGRTITTRTDAYVQDGSGRGINIFSFNLPSDPPNNLLVRGNELRITGTVTEFQGVTEITNYSIELISSGNPLPAPLVLTTQQANNIALEGTYIRTKGVIESLQDFGNAANITINDGSGAVLLRIWATTGINFSGFRVGDSLETRAVMDIFNNAAQLIPAYQDEIGQPGALPGDGSGSAVIAPDSVGVGEAVVETLTISGTPDYLLETITITIPQFWQWIALPANVQLSGSGFSGAVASVQGSTITIRSAAVNHLNPGVVSISQLTSPVVPVISTFLVKTAVSGGQPQTIAASPTVKVGEGAPSGVTPIALIQDNLAAFLDKEVTVEGVVTLGAGIIITTRTDAYIQDNSGKGINLFSFDPPNPAQRIERGNRLRITGTVTEFGGVTEITNYSVTFISAGNPLPPPLFVSTNLANNLSFEGTYMKVVGVVTQITKDQADNDRTITLADEQGSVAVRVWQTTGINLGFLRVGDTLSVQGVMDVFNNASQIVPGYQDELIVPGKTARADGSGVASVSNMVVASGDTLPTFTVSLAGTIEEPIVALRIDLPKLWQWSGNPAEVALQGGGFDHAVIEVQRDPFDQVYQILLSNLAITSADTGRIVFNNLITPSSPLNSLFWIRSAGEKGRLQLINEAPRVNVGGGERYLIYDLQTNSAAFTGTVTVQGITTIGAGLLRQVSSAGDSLTTAYIQDESGRGINLFRFGLIQPELVRGNIVEVRGAVTEFNGVTEIEYTSITYLGTASELPQPVRLSNAQVNSTRWDGTLIATEGVIVERFSAGNGTTLEISDGRGRTNVRIWDTTRLNLSGFNENTRIFVQGVGSLFLSGGDSIFQILPAYPDQLEIDPTYSPSIEDVALKVEPRPFAPDRGETIEISYNAAAVNNQVTLSIFDLGGRLVTTLLDEAAAVIENTFTWDGRDRRNERVPLGAYICHLKVVEPVSAKTKVKMAPIVVGTVLK